MITNLKVTHMNNIEEYFHFVQSGKYMYKATYNVPNLFGEEQKVFNCQSEVELSDEYIKNKLIEYHLNEI